MASSAALMASFELILRTLVRPTDIGGREALPVR
jgi:hypothetical protein